MKQGTFEAMGYDDITFTHHRNLLQLVGAFQVVSLFFVVTSNAISHEVGTVLITLSLTVMAASVISFLAYRLARPLPAPLAVSYEDDRLDGGVLKLSYVTKEGKHRDGLILKDAVAHSDSPLTFMRLNVDIPVKGTRSSISVKFSNLRLSLELGFANPTEMESVYRILNLS